MPRVILTQTNFTAGEITPRCYGRVDIARYQNGAEIIENGEPLVHGGVLRRPGFRFVTEVKNSAKAVRLVPFIFSTSQAYIVELGDLYARFYIDGGQVQSGMAAYEVVTPYTESMIWDVDYAQGADTMFLTHPSVPVYRLRRFASDNWTMAAAPFITEPYAEIGSYPAANLTLSSAAVGSRTVTASAAVFLASDVGREIIFQGGIGTITAYTDTTHVTLNVTQAFPSTAIVSGTWNLSVSPQATCTPSAKDPVGTDITLTLSAAGWRAGDVGKYVNINGGLAKITSFTSATVVHATIVQELSATIGAPALAWTLESSVWGGVNDYPRAVTLREQRLWLGGSPGYPQQIWGSVTAEYLDFTLGTLATDAVSFPIASDELNPIRHLAQVKALLALTYGGEFSLQGGPELPIMPTNVQIKDQSVFGSSAVRPVRIGNELLMVQRGGRKIRALSADRYDAGQYSAPDLTALAEHITESGIVDMTKVQEPDPLLLAPRADGQMAVCSLDRDQDVIAWARWIFGGDAIIESAAVIPITGGEQLWLVVRLTVDGNSKRYIVYSDAHLYTDCAITGTSVGGSDTWTGLDHLEGCTVDCLADGIDMGTFTVTGGQIVLPRVAYEVEIGLNFVVRVKTLTPEIPSPTGSVQGTQMSINDVVVRLLNSIGGKVNDKELQHRTTGLNVLDVAPTPQNGIYSLKQLGWLKGVAQVEITQDRPYPFHLLSVTKTFTSND